MGWINHMHVMYAYPIQTHTCIHNTYVCQVLFCSKKREKSPPSSLSAHKSANAFSINTHTHMLMSICHQIIKRPGKGIAATNTVECLIKGACNLQYSIFTSLSSLTTSARPSQGMCPTQMRAQPTRRQKPDSNQVPNNVTKCNQLVQSSNLCSIVRGGLILGSLWVCSFSTSYSFRVLTFDFRVCCHFTLHLHLRGPNSGIEFNTLITKCIHGVVTN